MLAVTIMKAQLGKEANDLPLQCAEFNLISLFSAVAFITSIRALVPEISTFWLNFFRGWLPPYLLSPFASLGEGHLADCTGLVRDFDGLTMPLL